MSTTNASFLDNLNCTENFDFTLGEDLFDFEATTATKRLHSNAIRFGNTADVSVLYQKNVARSEKQEYATGAAMSAILIFVFIMVWFMLLITCTFLGPKRVGIFSGRHGKRVLAGDSISRKAENGDQDVNAATTDDGEIVEKGGTVENQIVTTSTRTSFNENGNDDSVSSYRKKLKISRIVVLTCSFGIVVCVALFIASGVKNLIQSTNNVVTGLELGQELTDEAVTLVDNALIRQGIALDSIQPLIVDINGICPNVVESICDDISDSRTCNFVDIPLSIEFQEAFKIVIDKGKDLVLTEADAIRRDLTTLNNELGKVSKNISSFRWAFAVATLFALLLLIANLFISYGIIVAWRSEAISPHSVGGNTVVGVARHRLMVPIFIFFVVMSWIFSMMFITGSIVSADVCYKSPDSTVLEILQRDFLPLDSIIREYLIFIVKGCPSVEIPDFLTDKVNLILNYTEQVSSLGSTINDDEFGDSFVETCGNSSVAILQATVAAAQVTTCNLGATIAEVATFLSCQNWRPLYRVVMYDAICFNGNKGFYVIAITQFCIVVFAMIMVSLRAAFKPMVAGEQVVEELTTSRIPEVTTTGISENLPLHDGQGNDENIAEKGQGNDETIAEQTPTHVPEVVTTGISENLVLPNSVVENPQDDGQSNVNTSAPHGM